MKTLPDYLREGLDIVSIGLNPSLNSVRAGFYFATPQNRFWKALNASTLISGELVPGVDAVERLFDQYNIGFTDLVKRASPGSAQLRAGDYRKWAPVLRDKLVRYQPAIAWFHGKHAYQHYCRYTGQRVSGTVWGRQKPGIGRTVVFVSPNPSSANAVFSLEQLVESYDALRALRDKLVGEESKPG